MKHRIRYDDYTTSERTNDVLDKISKYGIFSLTNFEVEFLEAHSLGTELEVHKRIIKQESENVFEDDQGYFIFEHNETEYLKKETHFIGILYVPDIEFIDNKKVEGRLEGRIILFKNGQISLEFESVPIEGCNDTYDIFEFCDGVEYELDTFMDYIISELKNIK